MYFLGTAVHHTRSRVCLAGVSLSPCPDLGKEGVGEMRQARHGDGREMTTKIAFHTHTHTPVGTPENMKAALDIRLRWP